MRVFILEDDPVRIKWFKENFEEGIELDITDEVSVAQNLLSEEKYDIILLDHDLGGRQMVSHEEWNTGSTVARMIHETHNSHLTVVVHSWNPSGAKFMIDVMRHNNVKCIYYPFGSDECVEVVRHVNRVFVGSEDKQELGK